MRPLGAGIVFLALSASESAVHFEWPIRQTRHLLHVLPQRNDATDAAGKSEFPQTFPAPSQMPHGGSCGSPKHSGHSIFIDTTFSGTLLTLILANNFSPERSVNSISSSTILDISRTPENLFRRSPGSMVGSTSNSRSYVSSWRDRWDREWPISRYFGHSSASFDRRASALFLSNTALIVRDS